MCCRRHRLTQESLSRSFRCGLEGLPDWADRKSSLRVNGRVSGGGVFPNGTVDRCGQGIRGIPFVFVCSRDKRLASVTVGSTVERGGRCRGPGPEGRRRESLCGNPQKSSELRMSRDPTLRLVFVREIGPVPVGRQSRSLPCGVRGVLRAGDTRRPVLQPVRSGVRLWSISQSRVVFGLTSATVDVSLRNHVSVQELSSLFLLQYTVLAEPSGGGLCGPPPSFRRGEGYNGLSLESESFVSFGSTGFCARPSFLFRSGRLSYVTKRCVRIVVPGLRFRP